MVTAKHSVKVHLDRTEGNNRNVDPMRNNWIIVEYNEMTVAPVVGEYVRLITCREQ